MKKLKCINLTTEMEEKITKIQVEYMIRYKKPIAFSELIRRILLRGLKDKRIITK